VFPAVHHVAFRTSDLNAAVRFYEDVLALRRLRAQPGYSVWYALGQAVLMLEQRGQHEPLIPPGSMELLCLAADAGEQARIRRRLAEAGVAIEAETPHTLYFRDPDGRRVGVSSLAWSPE
jgi:glyoxylase I family protein